MRTLEISEAQAPPGSWIDDAQSASILVTRQGKPAALIIGVEGHDFEDLMLETDPDFWSMIEERRRQPTMNRAELDEYLHARDNQQLEGNTVSP